MKKHFSIISMALVMLMAVNAKAQTTPVKSYIALYGGLAFAESDFGKSTYENNKAGFAKRGSAYALDGAVYFYKNFAIGAIISFQDHGELNSTDANTLAVGYTSSFKSNGTTVTGVGRFHSFNVLIGPQYSFTVKKFIIDLRASAGFIRTASSPQISIFVADVPNQQNVIVQNSSDSYVFGYGGNINLRYDLGAGWFIGVKEAYINSQGTNITTTGRSENVGRLVTKMPITELQTTIGITHSF